MGADIYVTYGGDTSGLEASAATAKAAVNSLTRELASLARQMQATGDSADSELGQKVLAAAGRLTAARAGLSGIKSEMSALAAGGLAEVGAGVEKSAGGFTAMLAPINEVKESLGGLVELFAGTFAVEKIVEFAKSMGELGEKTERTSQILGLTSEQVGELQYAFRATGTDASNLDQMVGRFEVSLAKAAAGTGPAAAGLKALGLNARDLVGLNFPAQMDKIADAVSHFADGTNKTAALQALGRGFVELIPLLDQGAAGFDKLSATADATNSVLDDGTTASLVGMQHAFVNLGAATEGVTLQSFKPFVASVTAISGAMASLAEAFSNSIKSGGILGGAVNELGTAFKGVATIVEVFIDAVKQIGIEGDAAFAVVGDSMRGFAVLARDVLEALAAAIPGFFSALVTAGREAFHAVEQYAVDFGTVLNDTLHLDFSGAKAAFGQMGDDAAASMAKIAGAFHTSVNFAQTEADAKAATAQVAADFAAAGQRSVANVADAVARMKALWGEAGQASQEAAVGGKEKPDVPALDEATRAHNKAAADQLGASIEATNAEVQLLEKATTDKIALYAKEAQAKQISEAQKVALTLAALAQGNAAEEAALQKELALDGLSLKQRQSLLDSEKKLEQQYADNVLKIHEDAAMKVAETWNSAMSTINGAMTSQINGLLTGTESWGTAFRKVLTTLTEDVIKFFVNWGLQQAETVARNLISQNSWVAANITGNTLITASQTSGAAAGAGAVLAQKAAVVTSDSGQAGAGVAAWLAPFIGPAAIPAGTAAAASVMAIGSADIGMWDVPRDQLTLIHQNELVMPAAEAGAFRGMLSSGGVSGGGGGGPEFHQALHISSVDSQSVADMFRWNRGAMMKEAFAAMRAGAHHGFKPA